MCYKLKIHAFNTHQQSYFTRQHLASLCSSDSVPRVRRSCCLLVSLWCSSTFSRLILSYCLRLANLQYRVFSKGTGSKLHLVHVPAICVYKPCLSFLLGFSLSSEPIALPSSSELFFSLFCTFNTCHGHIAPRAIKVTTVNFWKLNVTVLTTNSVGFSVFFA